MARMLQHSNTAAWGRLCSRRWNAGCSQAGSLLAAISWCNEGCNLGAAKDSRFTHRRPLSVRMFAQSQPTSLTPSSPHAAAAGGYGPKLESWAFAVDQDGLEALLREGVFHLRTCKLCDEGVVVKGEYGLTNSLMKYGYNVDTLMSMYRGVSVLYCSVPHCTAVQCKVQWRAARRSVCSGNVPHRVSHCLKERACDVAVPPSCCCCSSCLRLNLLSTYPLLCPARPLPSKLPTLYCLAYLTQVDWRDRRHWRCNNNVHPSRHGTYDGITMHPYETVFLKASWHVGEPFVEKYAAWALKQVGCVAGALGALYGRAQRAVQGACVHVSLRTDVGVGLGACFCGSSTSRREAGNVKWHVAVMAGSARSLLAVWALPWPIWTSITAIPVRPAHTHVLLPRPASVPYPQAAGKDTTSGIFDEPMYRYAISPDAQESHNVAACYDVLHRP